MKRLNLLLLLFALFPLLAFGQAGVINYGVLNNANLGPEVGLISNVTVGYTNSSSAGIYWTTYFASTNNIVDLGGVTGVYTNTVLDNTSSATHSNLVQNLLANTPYFYRVRSTVNGQSSTNTEASFRTQP